MSAEVKITEINFDSETGSGVILVDFWAPWCGPCKMQGPILEKVAGKMAGKTKIGKCNVDEEQELSQKYAIMAVPTLIVFKDGQEIERMVGLQTENTLIKKLNALTIVA